MQFTCISHTNAQWTFKSKVLPENAKVISSPNDKEYILEIIKVNFDNAGYYECTGYDKESRSDFYAIVELSLTGKYSI